MPKLTPAQQAVVDKMAAGGYIYEWFHPPYFRRKFCLCHSGEHRRVPMARVIRMARAGYLINQHSQEYGWGYALTDLGRTLARKDGENG